MRETPLHTALNPPRTRVKSGFAFGQIIPLSQSALPQAFAVDLGNTVPINSLTVSCELVHMSRFFVHYYPLEHQLGEHTYISRLG